MRSISGMAVLITGASSGIGEALACELHRRGARLALAARRADRLAQVAARCGGAVTLACDVGDPTAAEDCVRQAQAALGRLDTVVLNAGYGLARTAEATGDDEWMAILRVNLLGTAAGLRAAVPLMRAQPVTSGWRGQVMIVSSSLARRAAPDTAAYSASKAAQLSLAEAARVELAAERIAVTSVHPVRTTTPFFDTCAAVSGRKLEFRGRVPTQTPEQVARAMADAIARPRPEVWPHRSTRWLISLGTLLPGLADRIMAGHRR